MKVKREEKTEYGTVSLPMPLIEKIKEKIKGTGMTSVSSYVAFVFRQILSSPEPKEGFGSGLSKKEEMELRRRLKALGYI